MKLHALMIYYVKDDLLEMAVEAVEEHVDSVIMARGRWQDFPEFYACADDETPVFETEMDHRNHALAMVPDGDWFIIVDSDEIFFGNWTKTKNKIASRKNRRSWVHEVQLDGNRIPRPRILQKVPGMEYKFNHYTIMLENKNVLPRIPEPNDYLAPLSFLHLDRTRDFMYKQAKETYYAAREMKKLEWKHSLTDTAVRRPMRS